MKNKYLREIKPSIWVDVYDVLVAFKITNPADAHAIKKMLVPGSRGTKNGIQDREEAIQSLQRAIEIEAADADTETISEETEWSRLRACFRQRPDHY